MLDAELFTVHALNYVYAAKSRSPRCRPRHTRNQNSQGFIAVVAWPHQWQTRAPYYTLLAISDAKTVESFLKKTKKKNSGDSRNGLQSKGKILSVGY